MPAPQRFPLGRRLGYALGAAGWTITDRVIVGFALFFYFPPDGSGLPVRLEGRPFLFGLTAFGAVMLLGRIIDSIADPLVAAWSDQSASRFGRRRVFLAGSAVPLALLAIAPFFPPQDAPSVRNVAFLAAALAAFFFAFTLYVTPYLALIPELARDPVARVHLTTLQAYATLLGAMIVMIGIPILVSLAGGGTAAYRGAIGIACAVAALFLLIPVLVVDESQYGARPPGVTPGLLRSLRMTLANRPFRYYLGGNIAYWFAFNIVSSGALYFTTVLMGAAEAFQGAAFTATFGVAAVFFAVWNVVARRMGKRRALLAAGVCFVVACSAFAFIRDPTGGIVVFALMGIPIGALLVLPNAALADCTEHDASRTGTRREGMFFGAQGVLLKVNLGLSTAVLAALMGALGKDSGDDLGVRLAGPVAAVVVMLGMWCFWRYPEAEVLSSRGRVSTLSEA